MNRSINESNIKVATIPYNNRISSNNFFLIGNETCQIKDHRSIETHILEIFETLMIDNSIGNKTFLTFSMIVLQRIFFGFYLN